MISTSLPKHTWMAMLLVFNLFSPSHQTLPNDLQKYIEGNFSLILGTLTNIENKMSDMDTRMKEVETIIKKNDPKIEAIEAKVENMEAQMKIMEGKVEITQAEVYDIDAKLENESKWDNMNSKMDSMDFSMESIKRKIERVESRVYQVKNAVGSVESKVISIQNEVSGCVKTSSQTPMLISIKQAIDKIETGVSAFGDCPFSLLDDTLSKQQESTEITVNSSDVAINESSCIPTSGENWIHVGADRFIRFDQGMTWSAARELCRSYCLDLYQPRDSAAVARHLAENFNAEYHWLGARGNETHQLWLSGEVLNETDPWYGRFPYGTDETPVEVNMCLALISHNRGQAAAIGNVLFMPPCHRTSMRVLCG